MRPAETIEALSGFARRGAGTNSERRSATWLARQVETPRREARIEPFWCRPNWALAHAWHATLGLAGSLLAVNSPRVGGALVLVALLSVVADELLGVSPGRRLTFEHASQNVVGTPAGAAAASPTSASATATAPSPAMPTLIITANYDAGRTGLVHHPGLRALSARLNRLTGGRAPGWLGWLSLALVWLLVVAVLRLEGSKGSTVGVLQLIPTVGLVIALALLLELASSDYGPAAGDNGSGTAAAIALAAALDTAPPRHADVHLVLQGASDGSGLGLRRHLRARRRTLKAANTIVIGVGPCGAGRLRWLLSDGPLVPLRYLPRLAAICGSVATDEPEMEAERTRGRGALPAYPARAARLPAISITCADPANGLVPRSHRKSDTPDAIDPLSTDDTVQFGLMLVERIDAFLADRATADRATADRAKQRATAERATAERAAADRATATATP